MAKVLVERPRPGSRHGHLMTKGYRKRVRETVESTDGGPIREGMTRPYFRTKPFNENLAPLRRFVLSRVGRPWDAIHSEICERIDRGNVVQKHILTHLYDTIITDVVLIGRVPCAGPSCRWPRYGTPLTSAVWKQLCYVCPSTGLLRKVPLRPKRQRPRGPKPPDYVRVNDRLQCRFLDGRWELVTLAPLPDDWHLRASTVRDVVLKRAVRDITPGMAREAYGAAVYAASRRVLGRREQMQYPIPIAFISR